MKMQNEVRAAARPAACSRVAIDRARPSPPGRCSSASTTDGRVGDASVHYAEHASRAEPRPYATASGIEVDAGLRSRSGLRPGATLGDPGETPFTRGIQPDGYRTDARGRCASTPASASAEETNARFRYLLEPGQTGPVGRLRPADPDGLRHRRPDGGRRGGPGRGPDRQRSPTWSCCSTASTSDEVSTSMTINATAAILLALYEAVGTAPGRRPGQLRGTIQNDILKEYIARGTYIYPPGPSMRLVTDTVRLLPCRAARVQHDQHLRLPHPRGRLDRGAGGGVHASPTRSPTPMRPWPQACASTTSRRASPSSSPPTTTCSRRWRSSGSHGGSGRAWRVTASAPATRARMAMRFHVQTGGSTLTAQQPDVNVVRTTVQALAAILGGAQIAPHQRPRRGARPADAGDRAPRASHTTGARPRVGRGSHRSTRSAASYFLESLTDALDEGDGRGAAGRDRATGRNAGRAGGRVPAGRDRRRRVCGPAGARSAASRWSSG